MSVERLIIVCRGLFLQRTDVATAQILFRLWLPSPLEQPAVPDKLFDAFEHDGLPLVPLSAEGKSPAQTRRFLASIL
jgi:hypothetical protein